MSEHIDCAVIGAGAVGLATARALALAGREAVVLEAADTIGTGTSSRNSEVIHAGIYYPTDSLKARLCVRGRNLLYAYLAERGLAHRRCGKLIIATDEAELAPLRALLDKGRDNGVDDLQWLDGAEARQLEPRLECLAAVLSPSTGIIDSHAYMLSLQGEAEAHGVAFAFLSPVLGGRVEDAGIVLRVGGDDPVSVRCRAVVNCAGLGAQAVAAAIQGMPAAAVPPLHYAKGSYFTLSGRAPFTRLIYPVPGPAGLGIHYTLDLGGQGRFGPDVEWTDHIDYAVDPGHAGQFYDAIRRYWPDLADGALQPGYAGVRPKIQAPGEPPADFVVQGPDDHCVPGLVNLFGIESPGLTSSLALAEEAVSKVA